MGWQRSNKGRGGKGKGWQGKDAEQQARGKEAQEYLKPVDGRWHLTKASLRPYASQAGSPFFAQNQKDSEFLSLKSIGAAQQPDTSEILNRVGIALSEAGGTVCMGSDLLLKYAKDSAKASEALGFQATVDMLQGQAGQDFVSAAATFNKFDSTAKTPETLKAAAEKWVTFLTEDTAGKAKLLRRLIRTAAKTYLFGMEVTQWLAAAQDCGSWAKKMKSNKVLQPEQVQKWLRAPSDRSRLAAALVGSYRAQVWAPDQRGQALSDSDGERVVASNASDTKSSSSSALSSSSKEKVKKSRKKSKGKSSKKAKSRSGKRAEGRGKKDKKSKKRRSSTSGSDSDQEPAAKKKKPARRTEQEQVQKPNKKPEETLDEKLEEKSGE
jgi:hypothetical protein